MSRIYVVTNKATGVQRHVRANTLNAAIRAHAHEIFTARPCTADDIYQAAKGNKLKVLDAVAPEQMDIDDPKEPE